MRKSIAVLFFCLIPFVPCHAVEPLSVCFSMDGTIVQCSDSENPRLEATGNPAFQIQPAALKSDIQKNQTSRQTLTYARLEEDPFIPSEVMKAGNSRAIHVPPSVKFQESFKGLKHDAQEQELWPWRDVIEAGPKKLHYSFNVEDVTGRGDVRIFNTKVGVEYEVTENTAMGVEASRGIRDANDASAWGESAKEEKAAKVKYKIFF